MADVWPVRLASAENAMPLDRLVLPMLISLLIAASSFAADAAGASGAGSLTKLHDQIVREYLDDQWDQADSDVTAALKQLAAFKPGERSDVEYVRRTTIECRPAWWKQCKAGNKVRFRPQLWGHTMNATYDPTAKTAIQLNFVNDSASVTVTWDAAEMDSTEPAEHGFSKGELNDLLIWSVLGTADGWSEVPPTAQLKLTDPEKVALTAYLDFRGNVSGVYYAMPRARRWGLWLGMAAFEPAHAGLPRMMARKAVGAMFLAEVVARRDRYPSLHLPADVATDGAEEKLAAALKREIERQTLTLPEDKALREAIKTFAAANRGKVRHSGSVTLPNGTMVALDADADKAESPKRAAWLVGHLK